MKSDSNNNQRLYKGLITDVNPLDIPQGAYPYALNALTETADGDSNFLSMEGAVKECGNLPEGTVVVGSCYLYDDNTAVWLSGNNKSYIGIINKNHNYIPYVETGELNLSYLHPVNAVFRLRRSNSRVVYWVDGFNVPRIFNFDRLENYYSIDYKEYLKNLPVGNPDVFSGEKWENHNFDLIKRYDDIPSFDSVDVFDGGNIESGSYSIAIQLVDSNMGHTEWITTSNPVNIFVDSLNSNYSSIRGSKNIKTDAQNFSNASKHIVWTLSNLDKNFSFYRVAVLISNNGTGSINKAIVSELKNIKNSKFIYSGNNENFVETPITDIFKSKADISSAKFITQLENRLIFGGVKGTQVNWCTFQGKASEIKSEFVSSKFKQEDINSEGNGKNPTSSFTKTGYMWDEVYSFGIVYVFKGGDESPVFHIPGRPSYINNGMGFYENDDSIKYTDVSSCMNNSYWGKDGWGNDLKGQRVRHHRFPKRTSELVDSNNETDICGIKFTNIKKPHPDVIGFKIVRNERSDSDKLIFDNALLGPMTADNNDSSNLYNAFGLLFPTSTDDKKAKRTGYIFSPEHQFLNKNLNFDEIEIVGRYHFKSGYVPMTVNKIEGNGAYVNDVSPGTSYNPEYHKVKDPDGFDLQVLYKSSEFTYLPGDGGISLPDKDSINHLSASGYITKTDKIIYNASTDNKIGVVEFVSDLPPNLFSSDLLYVSLKRNNTTAYAGFKTRAYYKEHNNIINFDNNSIAETTEIYNGDNYTTSSTIVSTTYYDTDFGTKREKKSKVWKIIVGSVLVLAAIAVNVIPIGGQLVSAGLGTAAASLLTGATLMAISYGVSMISSGVEFEAIKNMIDIDYEQGLKTCIEDDVNKYSNYRYPVDGGTTIIDDRFLWFADRLQNIYFDSSINMNLRSGLTVGLGDFINSPSKQVSDYINPTSSTSSRESFEAYLINKLTVIDKEQGDGRLYTGFPTSEFYDINLDYLKRNKEKIYHYLPVEYDCCAKSHEDFKNRVHYSEQSYQEELLDNYRTFLPNNYRDIESNTGKITNVFRYNNSLYIHTAEALYKLPQNLQERVSNELVTFIGTGEFFAIPPQKIFDNETSIIGSSHSQATSVTPFGVFFISEIEKRIYILNGTPKDITIGNRSWFKKNMVSHLNDSIFNNLGSSYVSEFDNTYGYNAIGFHSVYDEKFNRIILTKLDYLPLFDFELYNGKNEVGKYVYNPVLKEFNYIESETSIVKLEFNNTEFFENKSWTISYSFVNNQWVSFHSYLPNIYINTPNNVYSFINDKIYRHNDKTSFCNVYGKSVPFIVEAVLNGNPVMNKILMGFMIQAMVKKYNSDYEKMIPVYDKFFTSLILSNERQLSGELKVSLKGEDAQYTDFMSRQVKDVEGEIKVANIEDNWYFNDFKDVVVNKTQPLFTSKWNDIKNDYPIDKIPNILAFDFGKSWSDTELFRGKYLSLRFKYFNDEENDIQITLNYVITNDEQSIR